MTIKPIRLSPSGPVITNEDGGTFVPGSGMRLRLVEAQAVIASGTSAIPTTAGTICTDGFGGAAPVLLELSAVEEGRQYRAELRCDLYNATSSHNAIVALAIETSVDLGVTWTRRVLNAHQIQPQLGVGSEDNGQAREASVTLCLKAGEDLGIVDGTTTKLQVRGAALLSLSPSGAVIGDVLLSSFTPAGGFTNEGTIHLVLEECL